MQAIVGREDQRGLGLACVGLGGWFGRAALSQGKDQEEEEEEGRRRGGGTLATAATTGRFGVGVVFVALADLFGVAIVGIAIVVVAVVVVAIVVVAIVGVAIVVVAVVVAAVVGGFVCFGFLVGFGRVGGLDVEGPSFRPRAVFFAVVSASAPMVGFSGL